MTKEEKAKAYDKALEHAKEWKEKYSSIISSDGTMAKDFDSIFPQLVESEDERIRKALINLVCTVGEYYLPKLEVRNKMLDYLEKQEEQKPVSNPKWTELTWKDINELERIINNVHYEFQNGIGEDSFGELVLERFKEYKDDGSMDEQKPVEPSGKLSREEHLYQLLIDQLITYSDYEYLTGKNPAWSEEDEKRIKQLIYDTEAIRAGYEKRKVSLGDDFNDELIKDCDEQIKWLKSLRPSWKPSEHQMNILKTVKDYVGAGSGYWGEGLGSLIDDLEKLM